MYSYDHDLAAFVAIGSATVSADGSLITSDPGIGVMKAGWHCGGNPNTAGTVANCPTCRKCNGVDCSTPDDTQTPPQNSPTDCKQEVCQGGIVSIAKDSEKPVDVCRKCQGGFDVSDAAKNATACDDGPAVCDIDKCQNGTCNHEAVYEVASFSPDPYGVDRTGLTAYTSNGLACMEAQAQLVGGSFIPTSAFRPNTYQTHLREVWDKYQKIIGWNEAECNAVKANITTDWQLHGLVYQPATNSNHSQGTAFDAWWNLPSGTDIDTLAQGCGLSRCVSSDNVHFCGG
jgi:hypothetical protein